jgi:hypothetical protein
MAEIMSIGSAIFYVFVQAVRLSLINKCEYAV